MNRRSAVPICVAAMSITTSHEGDAEGVLATKDDCMTAWAMLAPGDAAGQEMVKTVIRWHPHWNAGGYEPGVSQRFALHSFERQLGPITVAHCGHGATCNALARAVAKAYPNVGNPMVVCMREPPPGLDNPQSL